MSQFVTTHIAGVLCDGPPHRRAVEAGSRAPIRGSYDSAQSTTHNTRHWAASDALDADAANSLSVRRTLTRRSRYEQENNGFYKGIVRTQANYVVGRGPKLRMQTGSPGLNSMVEAAWKRWAAAARLPGKLRTAVKSKVGDGEAFIIARDNPNLTDRIKLDLVGVEAEQVTTPQLPFNEPGYIDGLRFDEWGNPLYYDVLPQHPGGLWSYLAVEPEQVPARFVLHLFTDERPGQHRGVPEITSTMGLFAQGRRYREATIAAAEFAASMAGILKTDGLSTEDADECRPFTTFPIEKDMLTALPYRWELQQMEGKHPNSTYADTSRELIKEQARPLSQSYNIAACDSSGYSFSGGKLDHLTYFVSVDVEQEEIETRVLDPLFRLWFAEAVKAYGWTLDGAAPPAHAWDWPARPQIDEAKTASARQINLATGVASLRRILAEDGLDFEDELLAMAEDYGVSVEELRKILLQVNLLAKAGTFAQIGNEPADKPIDDDEVPAGRGRASRLQRNGTARR